MEAPIYKTLDIYQVELDIENPRIKQYLENYKKVTRFFRRKPICFSNGMNPSI